MPDDPGVRPTSILLTTSLIFLSLTAFYPESTIDSHSEAKVDEA
jgi:hypothetical protein